MKPEIETKLSDFVSHLRKDDENKFVAEMLHLDFMHEVKKLMQKSNMTYQELAEKIGTSKSYIAQLFAGDKLVNLLMIARIQKAFDIHFEISLKNNKNTFSTSIESLESYTPVVLSINYVAVKINAA